MIGFVIVSHSASLAAGVRDLARQLVRDQVAIAVAGGLDDPADPIGTDPFRVLAAIESVYSTDGVVVFMDLGSAILSAETALDFLPAEQRQHVHLCAAPLVEGVMAAAVQAMAGAPLATVLAEANGALQTKSAQLNLPAPGQAPATPAGATAQPAPVDQRFTTQLAGPLGLHARPAARIVAALRGLDAAVTVASGAHQADARSMNQLLALATQQGDELTFSATGPEAGRALAALGKLAAAGFAEPHGEPLPALAGARTATITTPADRQGLAVVGGVVYGPAALYRRPPATVRERAVSDPPAEWQRFTAALRAVRAELTQLQHTSAAWLGEEEAAIFTAQAALLDDPDLQQVAADLILGQRLNAEAAWLRVTNAVAQRFAQAEQSYWRQRAADLQDIQNQVVHYLLGMVHDGPQLTEPSILVAADLPPTVLARLPAERLLGLLVEEGGVASHTAIIARALGLPTVMGLPGVMNGIRAGQVIALDGDTGRVWLQPDRALRARLTTVRKQAAQRQAAAQDVAHLPATLRDGKPLPVMANLSTVQEAQRAIASGAEGVGLLRTEFLFINRLALPDEEEQVQAYTTIAAALAGRPLVIRTLDLGGDKPAPYLGRLAEANPELGWRGIRYWLAHGEIAHTQLRAILRVGAAYPVKILFPMVATLAELAQARQAVTMAQAELRGQGLPCANRLETGVMVETPAAVFLAPQLAACVDFFSIGTNDLTQFVMAADRNNPQVAALANAHQPAVLRAIQQTVQAAHQAGVRVTVCGEVASDPDVALLLIGLGVDELSVNLPAIPAIKSRLRGATLAQTIALAEAALEQETATAVIAELRKDSNW